MKTKEEKKISLRFRLDRERDRKALEQLEKIGIEQGLSYNEVLLNMLTNTSKDETKNDLNAVKEQIVEGVTKRMEHLLSRKIFEIKKEDDEEKLTEDSNLPADESEAPDIIDADTLSFMDGFGT